MKIRVSSVQYHLHTIECFEQFAEQVTHYVKTAQEFDTDFILFPEFFTTQLLSFRKENGERPSINDLPDFTEQYRSLFTQLAKETNIHIIAGTHVVRKNDKLYNIAHLFYPDGRIGEQAKLHITPTEVHEWHMAAGESFATFETEKGKIAMLTCYDIEFPEIVRMAKAQGVDIIFCPSCTDDRHGFHRVRYTSHARTIENQLYVVTASTVGSLPTVDFMRANFGQSAILSPNDIPFPPDGIIAQGEINNDMIVTGDLNLDLLYEVREKGSVTTWRDRRVDLYTDWK
jgi:predicted amidohydrolase